MVFMICVVITVSMVILLRAFGNCGIIFMFMLKNLIEFNFTVAMIMLLKVPAHCWIISYL
jgi:hypothetical protein